MAKVNPIIILVGPSGAGKSTFIDLLVEKEDRFVDTITYTTRSMRKGESAGNPYHFVTEDDFQEMIQKGRFVEWAKVHNNFYGTPRDQIEDSWKQGRVVLMDVDVQGAKALKAEFPQSLSVFILPPSIDHLRKRVAERDGGPPKDLELRMSNAEKEMSIADEFDFQLVNQNLEEAFAGLEKKIEEYLKTS